MFNLTNAFTTAATEVSHGRYAAKLTDTRARRDAFSARDIARATANDARATAQAAYDAARNDAKWLSESGQRALTDAMRAWGLIARHAATARMQWRTNGAWRDSIRAMIAARNVARVIDSMPLSPGDATHRGLIYAVVASHVGRGARGEKNSPLTADNVSPADVWQYAAELAIRAGDTVGGMPTYGGMFRHHKAAAAHMRRDAFARRAGYITISIDDADAANHVDALATLGYVNARPEAPAPLDPDMLVAEWNGKRADADVHAHRAALADMRADIAERANAERAANDARRHAWGSASLAAGPRDDAAIMGDAVVMSLIHGHGFSEIRDAFNATDATYERYARAAAAARNLSASAYDDADVWSAERDVMHACAGMGVECHTCTVAGWIVYDAAIARRERASVIRYADDVRPEYADSMRPLDAYAPAPLAPANYTTRATKRDVMRTRALIRLSRIRANAIIADADKRAAEVIASATDAASKKAAGKRANRIIASAAELAAEVRSMRAGIA